MVHIKRISGDPLGVSLYQLILNDVVIVEFEHNRPDDLPTLLRLAADNVDRGRAEHGDDVYNTHGRKQW